jgi:Tfp pilus assembly protein PilZ/uncharacterized Zn finger protein (UPF0148 family)
MTECPNCGKQVQGGDVECSHCGTDLAYVKQKLSEKEAEAAEKEAKAAEKKQEKKRVAQQLFDLIKKMSKDQMLSLLEAAEEIHGKKKRAHERFPCLITADCVYQDRAINEYVKDISEGGLYLETSESFDEGEEIAMTISFSHHSKPFKITGEIVRTTPQGIGVQFKTMSQIQEELIQNIVKQVQKFKK